MARRARFSWPILLLAVFLCLPSACSQSGTPGKEGDSAPLAVAEVKPPAEYERGQKVFKQFCLACHGPGAAGTDQGPPLVHRVYEPNHHGDMSFVRAAQMGVRAHHWKFGNMPKIEGISDESLREIIAYVRWLQRQAGIQ